LIVHARSDDVAGQEIRRELNPFERAADCGRECPARQRLRDARRAFEQHVAARDEGQHQRFERLGLTDDRLREGACDRARMRHREDPPGAR
jgi:hypothetical protein